MSCLHRTARALCTALLYAFTVQSLGAQGNYEIQVYGSETVPAGHTMMELHSNFTVDGHAASADGLRATNHAQHETLEITHGFSSWAEIGFYVFTSAHDGDGLQWVGDHIRPRVRVPESWGWPLGVSVSQEIGYQRADFSPDTWTYELRPIVDRKAGRWYGAFNPALEKSLHGPGAAHGFEFSPNASVGFDVTHRVNVAVEYYGAWGPVRGLDAPADREQQIYGALNLDLGPDWEFNLGLGQSLTSAGDHRLIKVILGRLIDR
jgi:hypothetical protein